MVKCVHCEFDNPDGEKLCLRCGMPLEQGDVGGTHRLDDVVQSTDFTRWGTASLGMERKLRLLVRGFDDPIEVSLSERLILGRYDTDTGESPDIDLAACNAQEQGVSRRHAALLIEDESLKIVDLGSANATHVNGQKLLAHQARILRDGDELRLGKLVIRVHFA